MIESIIVLFIIITFVMLIISIIAMESERPEMSLPFISLGLIFSALSAYGMWDFETVYIKYANTTGDSTQYFPDVYSTLQYGDPYSYVFLMIFFMFCAFLVRAGWNYTMQQVKNEKIKR